MAEQLPTDWMIHPGWWIAASVVVVCGVWGYLLMAGFATRIALRCGYDKDGGNHPPASMVGFFWPVTLPVLAGYYWAKSCEPKPRTGHCTTCLKDCDGIFCDECIKAGNTPMKGTK